MPNSGTTKLTLIDKGTLVEAFWHAVDHGTGTLENIPGLIRRVIETDAWKKRIHEGQLYEHKRFIDFITSKPLAGCGWDPDKVLALIKGDSELETLWSQIVTPSHGGERTTACKIDNVKLASSGNSRGYWLPRLKREAPALYQKVLDRKLSPNAAAIQAGFRIKTISVPLDAQRAVSILRKYFKHVEIGELK